jgi:N-acetylglutamate synthase/N-acetylornithine aminotransferase
VTPECWRSIFKRCARDSFNQISVDGDTSTNDSVIGLASGAAGGAEITDGSPEAAALEAGACTRPLSSSNLSRFCHKMHPTHPSMPPYTS